MNDNGPVGHRLTPEAEEALRLERDLDEAERRLRAAEDQVGEYLRRIGNQAVELRQLQGEIRRIGEREANLTAQLRQAGVNNQALHGTIDELQRQLKAAEDQRRLDQMRLAGAKKRLADLCRRGHTVAARRLWRAVKRRCGPGWSLGLGFSADRWSVVVVRPDGTEVAGVWDETSDVEAALAALKEEAKPKRIEGYVNVYAVGPDAVFSGTIWPTRYQADVAAAELVDSPKRVRLACLRQEFTVGQLDAEEGEGNGTDPDD